MTEENGQLITMPVHTPGVVEDYFVIEGHVLSTRTADAYKALDRATKQSLCLWRLRQPLPVNSEAVRRFLARMGTIGEIDPPVADFTTYGVDASGVAFAVFPPLHGEPLWEAKLDVKEAERCFLSAVRQVEALHAREVICGDLGGASFWLDRAGQVLLVGIMGSLDAEVSSTASHPPAETLYFVSPEQAQGRAIDASADVYALGVLGYHLFTGTLPEPGRTEASEIPPPSAFGKVPNWADEVILKCLEFKSDKRFPTAGALHKAVQDFKTRIMEEANSPARIRTAGKAEPLVNRAKITDVAKVEEPTNPQISAIQQARRRIALAVGAVLIAGAIIVYKVLSPPPLEETRLQSELETHLGAIENDKVRQAVVGLSQNAASLESKKEQFSTLSHSDDPLSHTLLVKAALEAGSMDERDLAEKALIERAQRLGLARSAEQVRQWLRTNGSTQQPAGYEAVLKALDTTLPASVHQKSLQDAYPTNPRVILRLVAALALDTGKYDEYQGLITQFLSDSLGAEEVKGRSSLGMMLASSELSLVFGEDALVLKEKLPDRDLLWLLQLFAERSDANVKTLATLAVSRNLFSPMKRVFIEPVMSKVVIPQDVLNVLMKIVAGGAVKKNDIAVFGRWFDADAERILLALSADPEVSPEVKLESLEVLAGKSLVSEPAASLVSWLRSSGQWDKREEFAEPIGVLGASDLCTDEQIEKSVRGIERFLKDPDLFSRILAAKNTKILKVLVSKFPQFFDLNSLIGLLGYPSKEIKLLAMTALEPRNDILTLKLILDAFNREEDPELRKEYSRRFWVVREQTGEEQAKK